MEKYQVKTHWLLALSILLAAFIALPTFAYADEANADVDGGTAKAEQVDKAKDAEDASATEKTTSEAQEVEKEAPAAEAQGESGGDAGSDGTAVEEPAGEPAAEATEGTADANAGEATDGEGQAAEGGEAVAEEAAETPADESASTDTAAEDTAAAAAAAAPAAAPAAVTVAAQTTTAKKASGQAKLNGWYFIQSAKKFILMLTGSKKNANVKNDKASGAQKWYITYNAAKGAYTLKNYATGKYLAVKKAKKGANVRLVANGNSKKSFWKITKNAAGGYVLKSITGKFVLDINNGKKVKNKANVDIQKQKKSKGKVVGYQRWYLLPVFVDSSKSNVNLSNGYYQISLTKSTSMTVTDPGKNQKAGTQMTSTGYGSDISQKFYIEKNSDNTYTLKNAASNKYLQFNGNSVVQADKSGADDQKWRAVSLGNGIEFVNVATGQPLSIAGASTASGAKAVAGPDAGTNNPANRFTLKKHNLLDNGYYYVHIGSGAESAKVITTNGSKNNVKSQTYYNDNGTFQIKSIGGDVYQLINLATGKALIASGGNVLQGSASGNNAKWSAEVINGGIVFTNKATGQVMASNTANASNVHTATKVEAGATEQSWYLQKAQVLKAYQKKALKKVIKRDSKRNYYLFVDVKPARMMIWERPNKNAEWRLKYDYIIAYGRIENGKTRTPLKDAKVISHKRWLDSAGAYNGYWSAPWAVRWSWASFHARTHAYKHKAHVVDKRLGKAISNGCVRMEDKYAKWLYYNFKAIKNASVTVWKNGHF